MAPVTTISTSTKGLQANNRSAPARTVVPVIPLAYEQRRQKLQVALAKARDVEREVKEALPRPLAAVAIKPTTTTLTDGTGSEVFEKIEEAIQPHSAVPGTPEVEDEDEIAEPAEPAEPAELAELAELAESVAEKDPEISVREHSSEEPPLASQSEPSDNQSSASRSTYQMPPPFVPANHGQNHYSTLSTDFNMYQPPLNFNNQFPVHHAHPSAGSVRFGGYPESNNSSPAPPQSAGNMPPYSYQPHHGSGRHAPHQSNGGHSHHMSNGYSPMGPPPPGHYARQDGSMNQGLAPDNYPRRSMVNFVPTESYAPSPVDSQRHNYDPSTPHSFHGSQSSVANDQEAGPTFHAQYATAVISNGSNGHIDEVRLYQQPRQKPRQGSVPTPNNFPPPPPLDHYDGLIDYLRAQFGDPTFADFTLELRYSDDRAPPVRIPGHNLMFGRSPTLKSLMASQAQDTNNDGMTARTLLIESDDPFLRSDGFCMAVQRLYGGQLLELGPLAALNILPNSPMPSVMPGTNVDRFDLGLGYAAAGHILQIMPVVQRGVEIASQFITWATIEKGLDFALDGGLDSSWTLQSPHQSTYGPAVNMIIHNALNFIIQSFPPDFELDVSVGEFLRPSRLPVVGDDQSTAPNPRLSFIKFGDHPTEESIRLTTTNSKTITLSKILINLPFYLMKYILESPRLGDVQGWATTALRQKAMIAVVEEREKRRMKVYGTMHISSAERKANHESWEVVGYQETVCYLDSGEPKIGQRWVDYVLPNPPE